MWDALVRLLLALALSCAISGCENTDQQQPKPSTTAVKPPPLAAEVAIYNLEGDLPTEVLEAFTREFGVKVIYEQYVDQEEAVANLRAGKIYDVVVLENRLIPQLIQEKLLAELNHANLLNIKNIAANFRDLAHDPGNRYSVPYNWGTTAMVVRKDLVAQPVTRWTDLWDPRYAGKVGLWMSQRRDILGLALKSLGYSANSENPAELEAALERLQALIPNAVTLEEVNAEDSSDGPDQVARLLRAARMNITSALATLEQAVAVADYPAMAKAAATLKATLLQCGLGELAELADQPGSQAAGQQADAVANVLLTLHHRVQQLVTPTPID